MRLIFFIFFSFLCLKSFGVLPSVQKERADVLYSKGLYQEAGKVYDSLLTQLYYSKPMLYRMAYIAERFNHFGEAIFFLRKVGIAYGDKKAQLRMNTLIEKSEQEGLLTNEGSSMYDFLNRNTLPISGLVAISLFLSWIYHKKRPHTFSKRLALSVFIVGGLVQIVLLLSQYGSPSRCVLVRETAFYESPSYGTIAKTEAVALGSVMEIQEKNDIWYQVVVNHKKYWLPFFTVREL